MDKEACKDGKIKLKVKRLAGLYDAIKMSIDLFNNKVYERAKLMEEFWKRI